MTLADGSRLSAPLIAVCEGRGSATRDAAAIPLARWSYHHGAMIGAFAHAESHENVAYEIFYPSGPFAILPLNDLPDGRHRSAFVWSVDESDAPAYMRLGPRGYRAELLRLMGGILGEVEEIAPRALFPLSFQRATQITAERMALVGDSAHAIHPIAGQGFNLGLRDVAALVEILVDGARLGMDLGDAQLLERYSRWRGLDNLSVAAATDINVPGLGDVKLEGATAEAYRNLGGQSRLGLPTALPEKVGDGTVQAFANGTIFAAPATGAHLVQGEILKVYTEHGGAAGALGFPTADEAETAGGPMVKGGGWIGEFQNGSVTWLNDGTGTFSGTVTPK